jgi:hypothetical protein
MNYKELLELINKYWADRSRSAEETKDDLMSLRDELDILIDAL